MKERIICGDSLEVLKTLESESVDCCITSPPYFGLRDYGAEGQIGLEETPEAYVQKLVDVFREVRRVLKKEGTLWLNLGDSYNGNKTGNTEINKNPELVTDSFKKKKWAELKTKDLIGVPWRVAFALQADGWYLRQDIIWHKPNPMPESVTDRCTKSHEYVFLLSKCPKYYFDHYAIQERSIHFGHDKRAVNGPSQGGKSVSGNYAINKGGAYQENGNRNRRSVWTVNTHGYDDAHFATFPEKLVEPMVLAGCPKGGVVLDCFSGAATTGVVAKKFGRNYIGIELNPEYVKMSEQRLARITPPLF